MKKLIVAFLFFILFLPACSQNEGEMKGQNHLMDMGAQQNSNSDNKTFQKVKKDTRDRDDVYYVPEEISENIQDRYDVAERSAERVSALDGVKSAYVITMDGNAYVAVILRDGMEKEKREQLEEKIEKTVKSTDEHIKNVYISANPDFVQRLEDYVDDVNHRQPVKGIGKELTEFIERIFPSRP